MFLKRKVDYNLVPFPPLLSAVPAPSWIVSVTVCGQWQHVASGGRDTLVKCNEGFPPVRSSAFLVVVQKISKAWPSSPVKTK